MRAQIPLTAHPNQVFDVAINNQYCVITLLQRDNGLYFGLGANGLPMCDNVLCLNKEPLIFTDYRGFIGSLTFYDNQGDTAPVWDGLGSRFELIYEG